MIGHTHFRVSRGHARHQLRGIGIARHNGAASGLSNSKRFVTKDERDAILLADPSVAGDTILIEKWA